MLADQRAQNFIFRKSSLIIVKWIPHLYLNALFTFNNKRQADSTNCDIYKRSSFASPSTDSHPTLNLASHSNTCERLEYPFSSTFNSHSLIWIKFWCDVKDVYVFRLSHTKCHLYDFDNSTTLCSNLPSFPVKILFARLCYKVICKKTSHWLVSSLNFSRKL